MSPLSLTGVSSDETVGVSTQDAIDSLTADS